MNTFLNWLATASGWIASFGLLGLAITLGYREWDAWRTRKSERNGLLYLLDIEIHTHQAPLRAYQGGSEVPTINDKGIVVHFPVETLTCEVWKDVRIRLAQLMRDKDEFQDLAVYFHNVDNTIRLTQLKAVPYEKRQALYSVSANSLLETSYTARKTIKKYVRKPYVTYDLFVDLEANPQPIEQQG